MQFLRKNILVASIVAFFYGLCPYVFSQNEFFIMQESSPTHDDDKKSLFHYTYETELFSTIMSKSVMFPSVIKELSKIIHKDLATSFFFDSSFVRNPKKVREYYRKKHQQPAFVGTMYTIYTDDGQALETTYFNRGSSKLLVVAPGFTNEREIMIPFVAMFPDYDVVLFDFRGQGYKPNDVIINPIRKVFGVDNRVVTFGKYEENDIFAVVDGFKKLKLVSTNTSYEKIFGLGICFGAFVLSKTASIYPDLFDKIILDGCWLSLNNFLDKIKNDLFTLFVPQTGGWRDHWFFGRQCVKDSLEYIGRNVLFDLVNPDIDLSKLVKNITKTDLLFFYGKDDLMINRNEFEDLWQAFPNTLAKTAIITSNPHVINHMREKELYKTICDLFLTYNQPQFLEALCDPDAIMRFYTNKISDTYKHRKALLCV